MSPPILVEFQYNPTQLTDKRSVTYSTVNAPGQLMPLRHYNQGGDRTITFTAQVDGLFRGPRRQPEPDRHRRRRRHRPGAEQVPRLPLPADARLGGRGFLVRRRLYADEREFSTPPTAQFGFGDRGEPEVIDCVVTEVSINETLFNENLAPLRAEVSVTLVELVPYGLETASAGGP